MFLKALLFYFTNKYVVWTSPKNETASSCKGNKRPEMPQEYFPWGRFKNLKVEMSGTGQDAKHEYENSQTGNHHTRISNSAHREPGNI